MKPRSEMPDFGNTFDIPIAEKNALEVKRILDECGVKFWLMFGTFLGVYRDGGIIPYDHDVDFAILVDFVFKLEELDKKFTESGFEFWEGNSLYSVTRDGVLIDFYFFHFERGSLRWHEHAYPENFFADSTIRWMDIDWRILEQPEKVLAYIYDDDWKTPIEGKPAESLPLGFRSF